jgi:preprotein translocase subunit SecE
MAKNDTTGNKITGNNANGNNTKNSNKSAKSSTPSNPGNAKVSPAKNIQENDPKLSNPGSDVVAQKGLGVFFSDVQLELSKVAWPSRQQLISESIAVLLMVIVAAVLVYFVDSLFGWAASQVFQ